MKRWSIVLLLMLSLGAALCGTYDYETRSQSQLVADELLAYELTPMQGVQVAVPAGTETVQMTSWAVLAPDGRLVSTEGLPYTIEVELTAHGVVAGGEARQRVAHYSAITRVTGVSADEMAFTAPARLADGPERLTDPRTLEVNTRMLAGHGGRMRVRALAGEHQHLLVRLSYRFSRGAVERTLFQTALGPAEAQALLSQTTALGFVDLPPSARDVLLSYWGRRLTALGRVGQDYRLRRVLVGARMNVGGTGRQSLLPFDISPQRCAAFNFSGPLRMSLQGPPGFTVQVSDGEMLVHGLRARLVDHLQARPSGPRAVSLDEMGRADVDLSRPGLRTVVFSAAAQATLHFTMAPGAAAAQLGDVEQRELPSGRLSVMPDIRYHRYYQLQPAAGLRYRVAPGQGEFRVLLRARGRRTADYDGFFAEYGGGGDLVGHLRARWLVDGESGGARSGQEGLSVALPRSDFDDFDDVGAAGAGVFLASDPHVAYLFPPAGVSEVILEGDPQLAVSVAVREPFVERGQPQAAYDVALDVDQRLVHAPQELSRWARVEPDNMEGLVRAGRKWRLRSQVRLLTGGPREEARAERSLRPRGRPPQRTLWVQRLMRDRSRFAPSDLGSAAGTEWFELGAESRLRVAPRPGRSTTLKLRYDVSTAQLGQTLRFLVDGVARSEIALVVSSGTLSLPVSPGVRHLQVEGLGEEGVLYADAPPRVAMEALRAYSVFELRRGTPLDFVVVRADEEPLSIALFVVTEGHGVPWQLRHTLIATGGKALRRPPRVFFREPTTPDGTLAGVSGEYESGLLWEAPHAGPRRVSVGGDGVSKVMLHLGDDLTARRQVVRLSLPPGRGRPERLWLRAVLVGQGASAGGDDPARQWTQEVTGG